MSVFRATAIADCVLDAKTFKSFVAAPQCRIEWLLETFIALFDSYTSNRLFLHIMASVLRPIAARIAPRRPFRAYCVATNAAHSTTQLPKYRSRTFATTTSLLSQKKAGGYSKLWDSADHAVADVKSGSTILSAGFGLCGVAGTSMLICDHGGFFLTCQRNYYRSASKKRQRLAALTLRCIQQCRYRRERRPVSADRKRPDQEAHPVLLGKQQNTREGLSEW